MLASLVAFAIGFAQEQSWWDKTSDHLRSVASSCENYGITFSSDLQDKAKEVEASYSVGRLEITGGFDGPDHVQIGISTMVGLKKAMAVKFDGMFTITPDGNAKEASGGLYMEGVGLAAKIKKDVGEALTVKAEAEHPLASVAVTRGKPDESQVAFTVHLGVMDVTVDPVKYAKRLREMGPEIVKTAEGKLIGGVSLAVDGQAMAAALAHATEPPPGYYENRVAISLKQLLASNATTLGQLNSLDGIIFDENSQDVFLVGGTGGDSDPIPVERLASVARAVYLDHMQPFISLDPGDLSFTKPNRVRIGGVPEELRASPLIQTMLTADYAMKQLTLGLHKLPGFRSIPDFDMEQGQIQSGANRFWINPAPLREGDVCVSRGQGRSLYSVRTTPVILTAPLDDSLVADKVGPDANDPSNPNARTVSQLESDELTSKFSSIESSWPESGFGDVRQDLELTNVFSLIRDLQLPQWALSLLARLAGLPVPMLNVPTEYPLLNSASFEVGNHRWHVTGGVGTDQVVPAPTRRSDSATGAKLNESDSATALGPVDPLAQGPTAVPAADVAQQLFEAATTAYFAEDYVTAEADSQKAFDLEPQLSDNAYLLLHAMVAAKGSKLSQADFQKYISTMTKALAASPDSWKLIWTQAWLFWSAYLKGGVGAWDAGKLSNGAMADAQRVIQLEPSFADAYALRAQIEQTDTLPAALADWTAAIKADGKQSAYYYGRAGVYAGEDKLKEAMADLDASIDLNPYGYHVLLTRAIAEGMLGAPLDGVTDATNATALAPDDWQCYDVLGQLDYAAHKDEDAIVAMTRALKIRKPGEEEIEMAKAGKPGYPTFFERLDMWEDFIRFHGLHRDVMSALDGGEEVIFDPQMPYIRGKAEYRLGQWKSAETDLIAAEHYFQDEKDSLDQLIRDCKSHLEGK